jgi:membrane protease YdiL (CAAX protease family)
MNWDAANISIDSQDRRVLEEAHLPLVLAGAIFLSVLTWVPTFAREIKGKAPPADTNLPHRVQVYRNVIIRYLLILAVAFLVAFTSKISIFGKIRLDLKAGLLALLFLALNHLGVEYLEWKHASVEYRRKIKYFCPQTYRERLLFVPTTLVTALTEEVVYRAVFFGLFYQMTGNYWIASVASAVFFSMSHMKWSLSAVGTTFFVGLGLQYLVFISGGLYLPIAIHFIHNLINGIIYGRIKATEHKQNQSELQ